MSKAHPDDSGPGRKTGKVGGARPSERGENPPANDEADFRTLAEKRARQQQTVAELGTLALRGGEIDELLHEATRSVQRALKVDYAGVIEHQAERKKFVARAVVGTPDDRIPDTEIPDGTGSASGYALMTGQPVIIADAATETRFEISLWLRNVQMRSGMVVLIGGGDTGLPGYGTLGVLSCELRTFPDDDIFFLQGIANMLAAAVSRRRYEEALRVAKEEAELANSAKSSFLSRMSHELRTPLNAILGFSQLLQMDVTTERQQECVKHVLAGGQQLLALIDDVLDISRLEVGASALALEPIVAADAIRASMQLVLPLAEGRRVEFAFEDNTASGKSIFVNRQRLTQVLLNLLTNAVKYNRPGGRVTIVCRSMPSARLRISITDTGHGISREDLERLFVPFERLGAERTEVTGTGLGLALCRNLVEAQGGKIGVESVVEQGSTFWIQLPLAPPLPRVEEPPRAAIPLKPPRRAARLRRWNILYVEDNVSNLLLIKRLLGRYPAVRLLTATQGRAGLEMARRLRPDLILLDVHLPDLSGREVLSALQADPATRGIPVVVVSADALPANIEALLKGGARHYLTKPLDCNQLVDLLTELA